MNRLRRRSLAVLVAASTLGLLSGCEAPPAISFKGVDITGASFGQDFQMTDHLGRARALADFRGQAVVIFFGYAQCPDVCPTTMIDLAEARRQLGPLGERVQGLFVTVDPERDTPEVMRAYLAAFDPSFLALYAAPGKLKEVADSFRISYAKVPGKTEGSYTMDHSAGLYVYDPQGRIRLYHRHNVPPADLAADLRALLDAPA